MKSERLLQNRLAIKSDMEQDFVIKNMQAAFIKGGNNQKLIRFLPSMSKFIDRIKDEEVSGETLPLFSVFTHSFRLTCPRLLTLKPKR